MLGKGSLLLGSFFVLLALALAMPSVFASTTLSAYTVTSSGTLLTPMSPFAINVSYSMSGLKATPNGFISDPNDGAKVLYATWSWGDGAISYGWPLGLSHIYVQAGNYTIRLTAIDDIGNINTQISHVFVSGMTSQPFSVNLTFNKSNLMVIPKGLITDQARNSSFISLTWSWGDGTVSSGWPKGLNHTYSSPGNYSVIAVMSDNLGNRNTFQKYVVVRNNNYPIPPRFVPQIRTLQVGQNLTNGYITAKLENLVYPDKNGIANAQLVIYNNGVYTNQIVVRPLTTVKVNAAGTKIYVYVGRTALGPHNNRTAEVEVEYAQLLS